MANVNALQKKLEGEKKGSQKKTSLSSDKNTTNNNVISQDVLDLLNKQQQVQNKNAVNQVVSGNTQQQSQPQQTIANKNNIQQVLAGNTVKKETQQNSVKDNSKTVVQNFLTGNKEVKQEVKTSQKPNLADYNFNVGEYRKAEQENYAKNKEIAMQDERLKNILSMSQSKERDAAKEKYMQDTNLSWRLNELRNKNNKSVEEEDELEQLEHKLLQLNSIRNDNDTLIDDAILDIASVIPNTYNSAVYNADLLLQSVFNKNEKLTNTRSADVITQLQEGRNNTTQALNDSYGDWAGFLYQTGLSISDNLALRVLDAIAPGSALIAMGSNAAASKALEIGNTKDEATAFEQFGRGLISGGIEYLTEKVSFDALNNLFGKNNSRSIVRGIVEQAFDEGKEEGISYALNLAADALFGDEVKWSWGDFALSVLGGAISGGLMGTPATYIGNQRFNKMATEIKNNANVQQAFKTNANIEDISAMTDKEFANLLANSFDDIKTNIGEKKFNSLTIDQILELVPDYMTKGEHKMWDANNTLDFQQAINMQSADPIEAMTSRQLAINEIERVADQYNMDAKTVERIAGIVQNTGVNVVFTTDMKGQENADGYYENGTIYINPNGYKPYMQTLKHELTHHIQDNPKFSDIKNFLINEYQGTDASAYRSADGTIKHFSFDDLVDRTAQRYAEYGQSLSRLDAEFEALADLVSTSSLFADEKGINELANIHTDATLKQKIADFFGDMVNRFNGNNDYQNELKRIRDLYVNSVNENSLNDDRNYLINTASLIDRYKNLVKIAPHAFTANGRLISLPYQLKRFFDGKSTANDRFVISLETKYLDFADMENNPLIYEQSALSKVVDGKHKNKVPLDVVERIDYYLKNHVVLAFDGVDDGVVHNKGKKVFILDVFDSNNDPIIVSIGKTSINRNALTVNDISSIHGRTNLQATINRANTFYYNKKSNNWLQASGLQLPSAASIIAKYSIAQKDNKSIDSLGNTLSKEQQEYFKDSKVVDNNGNLKVMYRGGNEDINVFDRKKSRPSNLWGRGFYFTDSEAHAKQYGDVQEYYLNIINPLTHTNNITKEQILNLLQAIEEDGEDMDLSNYGYGATVNSIADSLMDKDDLNKLIDINTTAVGDMVKTIELFNELNNTNYDGLILPTETVVFNSNQIKKVDNKNPTSDKDIRYSIASDSLGRKLTQEQQEYFKDSKAVNDKGELQVLYHGSKSDDFSIFSYDKNKQTGTDYGKAYYFTSDYIKAKGYSYDANKDENVTRYNAERQRLMKLIAETKDEKYIEEFKNTKINGKSLAGYLNDDNLPITGHVKESYLNLVKPLIVNANGEYYFKVYEDYFKQARKDGNDGIIVKNVIDVARGEHRPIDVYIAFNENQIKDVNNLKPTTNQDVRYSISPKEINLKNVNEFVSDLTKNDNSLIEKAISINNYYIENQNELGMFAKNRLKKLAEMYAAGFADRKEFDDFKYEVNTLTRISKAKEMLKQLQQEKAELHNSGDNDKDLLLKINSKEQMLNKVLDKLIKYDTSEFDRTHVEIKPITLEQQSDINRLDYIKYKYNGNNQIHVEAFGTRGDLENYGNFTKEELSNIFGTKIANEIIDNVDETTKEIYEFDKDFNLNQNETYVSKIVKNAEKTMGVTTNANEVGYIDVFGKMLDFSGKKDSGVSNVRQMDHREIEGVQFDDFVDMGNIRTFPESGGFELIRKPNMKQQKALLNYLRNNTYAKEKGSFIGISSSRDNVGRNDVASLIFENGEKPEQILKEVLSYFPTEEDVKFSISSKYTNDIKDVLKKYGSLQMRNAQEVEQVLSEAIEQMATTGQYDESKLNDLMYVIKENVMAANDSNNGEFDVYKDIVGKYKNYRIYVDEKYRNFVQQNNIANKLRGIFNITYDRENSDTTIDQFYSDVIKKDYTGYFDDVDTEEDQLLNLANIKEYKLDERKMLPIGNTNDFFEMEDAIYNDLQSYLNTLNKRINLLPDNLKSRVYDVYSLSNAEKFVDRNKKLQDFTKYYINNINERAVGLMNVYTKRTEQTDKLLQDAIQEVAQGGDITNLTRDALINELVAQMDKTNEIKLDEFTEQQMKYFKADTDSTFKSIVKDELDNLIRDVSFAMSYTDGTVFDDKTIDIAQKAYEKELRAKYRDEKVKLASDIVGRTPEEQMKKMGALAAFQTKDQMKATNKEFDTDIEEGADVGQLTGVDAALINKMREEGVDVTSFNKTLSQNFDKMSGKSVELRELFRSAIERPLDNAKKRMFDDQKYMLKRIAEISKKYGIKRGTTLSSAVQWYGEGTKDVNDPSLEEYTLKDLQQEFPDKWEDIVACEKECRAIYEEYFEKINRARALIYPNPLEQGYVDLANAQYRVDKYERIIASTKNNSRYTDEFIRKQRTLLENAKNDVERITEAISSGDYTLNKVLPKRKDYFHHFNELAESKAGIMGVLQSANDYKISNKLSGLSADTKPKSKFTGFMQHRGHGDYVADAIGGLLQYVPAAEYASYIDPQIAHMRAIVKAMRDSSNVDDTDLAYSINYLTQYINKLAGKTFILDRIITEVSPHGRKIMQALKTINSRAKANAILGNMRSAISQFYNLPVGLAMIKNPMSMANGAKLYAQYLFGDKDTRSLMNESSFLQERYFDNVLQDLDLSEDGIIKQKAMWLTQFGDEVVTRNLWFGAYSDGIRQNMSSAEAIEYADNLTRNAVAGRGIGEVPLLQQSEVIKLLAPFQVEVNNQWQYIKSLVNQTIKGTPEEKLKAAWQMFVLFGVTWAMNELREKFLDGNRTGMDLVDAFIDVVNDYNTEEGILPNVLSALGRTSGEVLSNVPYAPQLLPIIFDEQQREDLFGESDPTRFGTTNIGANALFTPIADAMRGEDIDLQELIFKQATPFGGTQINRTLGYLQDIGALPSLEVSTKDGISINRNEVPGSYSNSGRLRFGLDTEDMAEVARGVLFGTSGTQAAREYYDQDTVLPMSEAKTQAYQELRKAGANHTDANEAIKITSKIEGDKDEDGDTISYSKGQNVTDYINSLNIGDEAKEVLYKQYALTDSQKEVYDKAIAAGATYDQLSDALFDIATTQSIKDANGKTVTNSKSLQIANYINNMNVSENVKNVLREEYVSKTVQEMSEEEVAGRVNNMGGTTTTRRTTRKSSSRTSNKGATSVANRVKNVLSNRSQNSINSDLISRIEEILKEFMNKLG